MVNLRSLNQSQLSGWSPIHKSGGRRDITCCRLAQVRTIDPLLYRPCLPTMAFSTFTGLVFDSQNLERAEPF